MAHISSNLLLHRFRQMNMSDPPPPPEPHASDKSESEDYYRPTPTDVIVAHIMLTRSLKLPWELVDSIFDMAEYWAHSINAIEYQAEQQDHLRISGSSGMQDRFLLRSYPLGLTGIDGQDSLSQELAYDTHDAKTLPLQSDCDPSYFSRLAKYPTPRLVNPARKIVFKMKSRDQGWGGEPDLKGTYKASWTWFEAGLERFDSEAKCNSQCTLDVREDDEEAKTPALSVCCLRPIQPKIAPKHGRSETTDGDGTNQDEPNEHDHPEDMYGYVHPLNAPSEWLIQCNKTATGDWQEHTVTWSYLDDVNPNSDAGTALEDRGRGRSTGDGSLVRSLRMGDVITIWGKARFPGWVNSIEYVKVEVYWAV
ncbi:hypothetical protein E4U57_005767 [Claviceps arundinis]|uniref:Ankyrin repeat protein n=1 Tax=Claviceps arundinis TaxID=1623583 RepID=A0ABQ7P2S4_9HYPO|nr:hypothetical protein E4U57_005767 [Claviceps arundinis]